MTNLRAPASRASSTFCFRSWRFPTINCPSTPTTTTPRLSFVRLKLMSAPRLEGRRPPPCPQYHRPSRRATGRRPAAPAPGGWARSPPTRRAAAPVCMRCCRCQDRGTPARWRAPPRARLAPCGRPRRPPAPRRPAARRRTRSRDRAHEARSEGERVLERGARGCLRREPSRPILTEKTDEMRDARCGIRALQDFHHSEAFLLQPLGRFPDPRIVPLGEHDVLPRAARPLIHALAEAHRP